MESKHAILINAILLALIRDETIKHGTDSVNCIKTVQQILTVDFSV